MSWERSSEYSVVTPAASESFRWQAVIDLLVKEVGHRRILKLHGHRRATASAYQTY